MKRIILVIGLAGLFLVISATIFADNVEVVLDSADGSSSLSVKDSADVEVAHIDSDGNIQADGSLSIDGGGTSYIMGNVGIGTTTPGYKLQVGEDGDGTSAIELLPMPGIFSVQGDGRRT